MSTSLTINQFLEPRDEDVEELRHTLADSARPISIDDRDRVLGQPEEWDSFSSPNILHASPLQNLLGKQITPRWQPWIPDAFRVIYSERMLETLYTDTLITRVNIALQHAIPSGNRRVTIIVCPGAFDSHARGDEEGKSTTILPDLVVLEGEYKPQNRDFKTLDQLASNHKVLAVGDVKISDGNARDIVLGTHSCHWNYLAQVQHYAVMTNTRFGFVLSNKELVLAQFLCGDEASPRGHGQRGLRSTTTYYQLQGGLSSDSKTSDTGKSDGLTTAGPHMQTSIPSRPKRAHASSDTQSSPSRFRARVEHSEDQSIARLPSTPPRPVQPHFRSSPPIYSQNEDQSSLGSPSSGPSLSQMSSSTNHPESSLYTASVRDIEIERGLVKSFRIPNPEDNETNTAENLHPAKALFTMAIHASSVGPAGRQIGTNEVMFGSGF
ncbi:hypothetical protein N7528_004947 [Penicillium herquei]|nr:hypothetical protein N7528_004947 [Penicillium herquei]